MVREGARQLGLVGGPVVLGGVVQDQQAQGFVPEHDRDVADRPDARAEVAGPDLGQRPVEIAAHDPDLALAHGFHAGGWGVAGKGRDDVEHVARQAALGGQPERGR